MNNTWVFKSHQNIFCQFFLLLQLLLLLLKSFATGRSRGILGVGSLIFCCIYTIVLFLSLQLNQNSKATGLGAKMFLGCVSVQCGENNNMR